MSDCPECVAKKKKAILAQQAASGQSDDDFSKNFVSDGAETTAKIVNEVLDPKK